MRYLVSDLLSYGRIFAVFDCCRVKLDNMPGLVTGRGLGNGDIEEDEGSDENSMCKYFHLQACGPGGIADADGGFAHRLLEACNKFSERAPKGYLELPRDVLRIKWAPGETTNTGGDDYLLPFGATKAPPSKQQTTESSRQSNKRLGKVVPLRAASLVTNDFNDISGKFEFEGEAEDGKWKYVTITKQSDGVYVWEDKEGMKWALT